MDSTNYGDYGLARILAPSFRHADFGKALAEQFANIDANFQTLSNLELSKGEPGLSCYYITYNLNAIFFKSEDIVEGEETSNLITGYLDALKVLVEEAGTADAAVLTAWNNIKDEVAADFEDYKSKIGKAVSFADYATECHLILFGRAAFEAGEPLAGSMYGELSKLAKPDASLTFVDNTGTEHTFYALWLDAWRQSWIKYINGDTNEKATAEDLFLEHFINYNPGRLMMASSPTPNNGAGVIPVSSLSYVYVDPRFRNTYLNSLNNPGAAGITDISCVLYYDRSTFKSVNLFPQIYYNGSGFFWKINGNTTTIPVSGADGAPGKNSQFVVVERVENEYLEGDKTIPWVPTTPKEGPGTQKTKAYITKTSTGSILNNTGEPGSFNEVLKKAGRTASYVASDKTATAYQDTGAGSVEAWGTIPESDAPIDSTSFFRIYRIVGSTVFYAAKDDGKQEEGYKEEYKHNPTYAKVNYGDLNAVSLSTISDIQKTIAELDGCPAVVVPGPTYADGRDATAVWFATLRTIPSGDQLMLVAYCGDENKLCTDLDENSFAGMMMSLDTTTYKEPGDDMDKPRGLMVAIGNPNATTLADRHSAHIIYSDFGGYDGGQGLFSTANKNYVNLVTGGDGVNANESQAWLGKRVLHIGSVKNYSALNFAQSTQATDKNGKPAFEEDEQGNIDYSKPIFASINTATPGRADNADAGHYKSELHIDEPTTITRYRDTLDATGTDPLLKVEGDVVIGMEHVNIGKDGTKSPGAGGLVVKGEIQGSDAEGIYFTNETTHESQVQSIYTSHAIQSATSIRANESLQINSAPKLGPGEEYGGKPMFLANQKGNVYFNGSTIKATRDIGATWDMFVGNVKADSNNTNEPLGRFQITGGTSQDYAKLSWTSAGSKPYEIYRTYTTYGGGLEVQGTVNSTGIKKGETAGDNNEPVVYGYGYPRGKQILDSQYQAEYDENGKVAVFYQHSPFKTFPNTNGTKGTLDPALGLGIYTPNDIRSDRYISADTFVGKKAFMSHEARAEAFIRHEADINKHRFMFDNGKSSKAVEDGGLVLKYNGLTGEREAWFNRPPSGTGDADITLTATISSGDFTKTYDGSKNVYLIDGTYITKEHKINRATATRCGDKITIDLWIELVPSMSMQANNDGKVEVVDWLGNKWMCDGIYGFYDITTRWSSGDEIYAYGLRFPNLETNGNQVDLKTFGNRNHSYVFAPATTDIFPGGASVQGLFSEFDKSVLPKDTIYVVVYGDYINALGERAMVEFALLPQGDIVITRYMHELFFNKFSNLLRVTFEYEIDKTPAKHMIWDDISVAIYRGDSKYGVALTNTNQPDSVGITKVQLRKLYSLIYQNSNYDGIFSNIAGSNSGGILIVRSYKYYDSTEFKPAKINKIDRLLLG